MTDYQTYLYSFELQLVSLELPSSLPKTFTLQWRKGQKLTRSQPIVTRTKLTHLNQTLKLCLKLSRNSNGEYLKKHTTLSLMQGSESDLVEVSSGRIDLAEVMISNRVDIMVSLFPEPVKIACKLRFEFVTELKHFRFGNQEIEESEEEVKPVEVVKQESVNVVIQEEKLILKKEVQDLNYLNQKFRTDREKLILKVRELEHQSQEKEKQVLREMRNTKAFFGQKIKLRESIYEEEIEKIVFISNERISECQDHLTKFQDQSDELKNKLKNKQSEVIRLREELIKAHSQKKELEAINKALEQDRDSKYKENLELIRKYEDKIRSIQDESTRKAQELYEIRENERTQLLIVQEEERSTLIGEIRKLENDNGDKSRTIDDYSRRLKSLEEDVEKKTRIVNRIDEMLSIRKDEILTHHQFQNVEISHKLESMLSQNKSIEQTLNQQMMIAEKERKELAETILKFESLTVTYKLERQNFNQEREAFKAAESVYQEEIAMLKDEQRKLEMEIEEMHDKEIQLENDVERLHYQNEQAKEMFDTQAKTVERYEQDEENLKNILEDKKQEIISKERELDDRNTEIERLYNQIKKITSAKEDLEIEINKLEMINKTTEELYNTKLQRQTDHLNQYSEMSKKQHQNELELERLRADIISKENQIGKLERKNAELIVKLKMKKKEGSEESDSFIFKSGMSNSISPKEGNRISPIEYAHVKAQMEQFKKETEKKDILLQQLNVTIAEKNNKIDELEERISKDVVESRTKEDDKKIEKELQEFMRKNERVNRLLGKYEERVENLMRDVFEIIDSSGISKPKNVINRLTHDFNDLQAQISQIKEENEKSHKMKSGAFGRAGSFSFVDDNNNKQLEIEIEDLQAELKEKNQEIKHLQQQVERQKRNMKARSESDIDDESNHLLRSRKGGRYDRGDDGRETFGQRRRGDDDHEENVESLKRHRAEKEKEMKESQMMKSSQMMDMRIQTLSHELKLKTAKEQELINELKQRIAVNKDLEDENRLLKGQNFTVQEQARKLQHSLQSLEREYGELQRSRESEIRNNNSNEIVMLNRENNDLKDRQAKARSELERIKEEYKDKYIRYSEHKDIISELDRAIKDKGKEIQLVRREVNDITQIKNKFQLMNKSQESELEEVKKKLSKIQDSQSSILEDKESELKGIRRKLISFERQEEELEGKIEQLQDKLKAVGLESERTAEEFNRRNINQLKEINLLKEQHEVLNEENKVIKRRNQQLSKVNNENEEKIIVAGKAQEEQRRKIDKMSKELQSKDQEVEKVRYQLRKFADEIKRLESTVEDHSKERKELIQDNNKLNKSIDVQSSEIRRLTKQLERTKNQANQTEHDSVHSSKTVKLQIEKMLEERRKLEKHIEEQQSELKALTMKLKKTEQDSAEQISTNSKVYGEKMSAALNQIEMIRKAVKEAELEIADYEVENRDLNDEIERLSLKINGLDDERRGLVLNLENTVEDNERKKEEIERLKKEKFDLELKCARAASEAQGTQEDSQKHLEKLHKVSQTNKSLIDSVENLESELRAIKIQYSQLMSQFNVIEPFESKYKHLEKEHKELVSLNEEMSTELRHKQQCIYTKADLQNYELSIKTRHEKEMELYSQRVMKQLGQSFQIKQEHIEAQILELLNENTTLRADIDKYRQENNTLINQNSHLLPYRDQAETLKNEIIAGESLITQLESQLSSLVSANKQSTTTYTSLNAHVDELTKTISQLKTENTQLQSSKDFLYSQVTKLESSLQKSSQLNEELNNKFLQIEFQNARLRENEIFERAAYEKRIQEMMEDEQGNLRNAQDNYIEKIHLYNNEMDKLKNILSELKYLVEEKTNTIEELNNEYDLLENELIVIKEEYQNYKLRSNEEKEIASLELFKMTTKLRESEDQSALKFRRMEEQMNRISQQLMLASNTPNLRDSNNHNKFNNSRMSEREEDRVAKRYDEKIKLKDRTIQQLKLNNMNLEAEVYRLQEERQFGGDQHMIIELRSEISRLKLELEKQNDLSRDRHDTGQIDQLNDQISTLKKKLAKSKANEESLTEELEEVRLKYDSLCAEMIYYKGLETANKELKMKYEQICDELRGSRLERSTTSDAQNQIELLESEKEDLQRKIEDMQTIIMRLGGDRESGKVSNKVMIKSGFLH